MKRTTVLVLISVLLISASFASVSAQNLQRYKDVNGTVKLDFYFPVGVAGPLASVMDNMVKEFNNEYPNIKVNPVYSGNYNDTMAKVQSAILSGNPPDVFVVEISELYTLLGIDGIVPLDKYIEKEGGEKFTSQYFEALYGNARAKGKIWGQPFQRSTPILYYNKDLFLKHAEELRAEGLDPSRAPRNWYELEKYAKILTERQNGETKTWGLILPGGWNDWIFEGFVYQNGQDSLIENGKTSRLDTLKVRQALQFWYKLTNEIKASPPLKPWNQTPITFSAGNAAMMYYSTGGLPLVRKQSDFDFGVSFQPMNVEYGVPVGGGDFHISKGISNVKQDASWEFIKFMTNPEMAAHWSRKSGYICINKKGLESPEMKNYLEEFPAAKVAADQLEVAYPKVMAPGFQEIRKAFTTNLDQLMQGKMEPVETQNKLHKEIQKILDSYN